MALDFGNGRRHGLNLPYVPKILGGAADDVLLYRRVSAMRQEVTRMREDRSSRIPPRYGDYTCQLLENFIPRATTEMVNERYGFAKARSNAIENRWYRGHIPLLEHDPPRIERSMTPNSRAVVRVVAAFLATALFLAASLWIAVWLTLKLH